MPYLNQAGLGVYNFYGPRTVQDSRGVTKTEGVLNEACFDLDGTLPLTFPTGARGQTLYVVSCDVTLAEGTLSGVQTVGGVDISGATLEAPVAIDDDLANRLVVIGGATGGMVLIRYKKYPFREGIDADAIA